MAAERTQITELATAAGMVLGESAKDLELLAALDLPGIAEDTWRPILEPAAEDWHQHHPILLAALANGAAFRRTVLKGRDPEHIDWNAERRTLWVSDAPADLRVNETLLVSAKYDSKCLLNRAPASLFVSLLNATSSRRHENWYALVAPDEYQRFYSAFVAALGDDDIEVGYLPPLATKLDRVHKATVKRATKGWRRDLPPDALAEYRDLARIVSTRTAETWREALSSATDRQRMGMLAQMTRICGSRYWLLGQAGAEPVRCCVTDTNTWRSHYRLAKFVVFARPDAGQPQVDWQATLEPSRQAPALVADNGPRVIDGICEIR